MEPPPEGIIRASDTGRKLFRQYATDLLSRCNENSLNPAKFIQDHGEPSAIVTYPVRCARLIEILGLLGLLEREEDAARSQEIAAFLADFCNANAGCAHPVSDHWAASLIAPALLLSRTGHRDTVQTLLKNVIRWIGDCYGSDKPGLAGARATPEEEITYLIGSPFEHIAVPRRFDSYVSAVVLELAALLEMGDIY